MPKHFSNAFAFCSSIFGYLLLTVLPERNPKGVVGWLRGVAHIAFSGKNIATPSVRRRLNRHTLYIMVLI
jgi:hypothetical protein